MLNRISLVCLVMVGLGAILWLSRNYEVVKVKPTTAGQMQTATNSTRRTSDLPEGAEVPEVPEVPESPRHAAGVIEKDRSAKLLRLDQAVRDQEAKVEERRKVLATIVRTKGIIYKGNDSFYGESTSDGDGADIKDASREDAIKRGLDAQDYNDAKLEFETDQALLQKMKLKHISETIMEKKSGR